MDETTILIFTLPLIISAGALAVWINRKGSTSAARKSKNAEKVIQKIKGIHQTKALRDELVKWSDDAIWEAASHQLSDIGTGNLLGMLSDDERRKFLSYYSDLNELNSIREYADYAGKRAVDRQIEKIVSEHVAGCKNEKELAEMALNGEETEYREEAVRQMKDQQAIADCAFQAAIRKDDFILKKLLIRLDEPEALRDHPDMDRVPPPQKRAIQEYILCCEKHVIRDAHQGAVIRALPGKPTELTCQRVRRCMICGYRETTVYEPEEALSRRTFPDDLKDQVEKFRRIQEYTDVQLEQIIRDPQETEWIRIAAAERITDEAIILKLLHEVRNHQYEAEQTDPVREVLVWQLTPYADKNLFETIAADSAYDPSVRWTAVRRISDVESLERLAGDPILKTVCAAQRQEVLCPNKCHDWELEDEEIIMQDEEDWGSIRWRVKTYRCKRCGATEEGPWEQC